MDSNNDRLPPLPLPMHSVPSYHSGRWSLLPFAVSAPHHALPTYPSSTLHFYYPSSHHVANYASIPSVTSQPFPSQARSPDGGVRSRDCCGLLDPHGSGTQVVISTGTGIDSPTRHV